VDLREADILFRSRSFSVEKRVSARGGLECPFAWAISETA
jgi:hypothetical protein